MFCSKSLWKSGIAPANNLLRCINTPVSRATPRFDRIFLYLGIGPNTRIEGHVPTAEFSADREAYVKGTMTLDEVRDRSTERASALDQAARTQASVQKTEI